MHFTTPKEKILNAVLIAERIVGKKESLPVLSCVLLDVGARGLSIRATNLEAGVEISVPGEVKEKGVLAIPVSVFSQTLRSIIADKVTLSTDSGNLLVESKGTKTLIKALPHDEFPAFAAAGGDQGFELSRETLISAIQSVSYAASSSMIRPELGSILLSTAGKNMCCVATDSFRLAEKTVSNTSKNADQEILIPLKHAQELVHVLERLSDDSVRLSVDDSQMSVHAESMHFLSRIVDGTFPNYKEIIPKETVAEATVLKNDFAEVLRKARVFSGVEQRVGFHVYPKKKVFDVTAQSSAVGEMSDSLEAALSGEELDMYFHIGYVSDCLSSIDSDSITLGFAGAGKPLVIRGVSDQNFLYLVMPLNR